MKESTLKPVKTTVRILTGLSFLLFIAYQLFLMMQLPEQRFGRLIGIILYLFITVASFFALSHNRVIRVLRSVFFLSGFIALFLIKLLNLFPLFGSLDFSNTPSVLNCAVYVATQIGTLIFVLYYLIIRTNKKIKNKKKITAVLMFFVIALYVSTLLMECVMIIKYRVNIDLSGLSTVISRFIYFFGFVSTAVSFMLPSTKVQSSTEQYINKKQIDEDVMVMSPKKESSHSDKDKKPNPVLENSKLVFSETENIRSHSDKGGKPNRVVDDSNLVFSNTENIRSHSDKSKKPNHVVDDSNLVFSETENIRSHSAKGNKPNRVVDSSNLVFADTENKRSHSGKGNKPKHVVDDSNLVFSDTEKKRSHSDKNKKHNRVVDNSNLVFSNTDNIRSHSKKHKK